MHQRIIKLLVDRISNNGQSDFSVDWAGHSLIFSHNHRSLLLTRVTDNLMVQSFLLFIYISIYDATLDKLTKVKGVTD